jgi:hypothetical protein
MATRVTPARAAPERAAIGSYAPARPAAGAGAVRRAIAMLGALNLLAMGVYTFASYGFARVVPFGTPEPFEARALERLANAIAPAGTAAGALFRGEPFAEPMRFFAAYGLLTLVPALVFIVALAVLARHRPALDEDLARRLFRWAAAFAAILAFAHPVLVQDFWLSAGWGELVSRGVNPYYVNLDPQVTEGLPLDYLGLLMTYGPLWALVSGGVMSVADANAIAAGLIFKAIVAGAWVASLALVGRLLRSRPAADQCVGMVIAGWLPLGAFQLAAEGHNDAGMAFLVLLWLVLLERGRHLPATAALAASVLIKYLSAPLFLLDLLHAVRSRGRRWTAYVPHAALAAAMAVAVFGVFFRSMAFFDSTVHMADWHFYTPRDGIVATGRLLGIEPGVGSAAGVLVALVAVAVQLAFVALIPIGVWRYWRRPGRDTFRMAVLLIAAGILFGLAGHLWPWFLAWAIVLAALHPGARITRWTIGVALAVPFALLHWTTFPGPEQLNVSTPPLYLFAAAWFVLAPRQWFGGEPDPAGDPTFDSLPESAGASRADTLQ